MILENDKPYYVVIGGVNGAGKSTIYQIQNSKRKELDTDRINADEILRRFGGNWNKQADINKSMREVLREIEGHFKEGKSFHHETTNVSIYDNSDEFSYIYVKENHTVVANNTQEYAWVPKAIQDKSAETPISKQIMMDISQEEMNLKETLERIYLASDNFISDRFLKAEQVDNFYLNHKNEIKERVLAISFSTGVSEDELVGQDKKRNSCKLAYINSLGELLEKIHRQLSGMEVKRDRNIKKSDLEME